MKLLAIQAVRGGKLYPATRNSRENLFLLPKPTLEIGFSLAKALQKFPHHGRKRGVSIEAILDGNCDIFHNHIFTFLAEMSKGFECGSSIYGYKIFRSRLGRGGCPWPPKPWRRRPHRPVEGLKILNFPSAGRDARPYRRLKPEPSQRTRSELHVPTK